MKRAIVVGSGAGGATVALELQGAFDVTIMEAGRDFKPLGLKLRTMERMKRSGLLRDPRQISWFLPNMRVRKAPDGMLLVNGVGLGGTTTLCAGNGLRMDQDLRALGIDLGPEFEAIAHEIPIGTAHQEHWRKSTRALFDACRDLNLDPQPTPKMSDAERCVNCGRCVIGCQFDAKWDSRRYLRLAVQSGARLLTGCKVERLVLEDGRATGVVVRRGWRRELIPADLIVLSAGGLGSPDLLRASGIPCEPRLFVDPVLCVAAEWPKANQCYDIAMPFVVQRQGFIVSPYFDYLSFFFNPRWRSAARDTLGLMIKLADTAEGTVTNGHVVKRLSADDQAGLREGVGLCKEILGRLGIPSQAVVLGTLNAGHPGGMLPLTARSADTLHDERLPANVYVADASLLPRALGNPPILTIVALAKRIGHLCRSHWA